MVTARSFSFFRIVELRDSVVVPTDHNSDLTLSSLPTQLVQEAPEVAQRRFVEDRRIHVRRDQHGIVEDELSASSVVPPHAAPRREGCRTTKQPPEHSESLLAPDGLIDRASVAIDWEQTA